MATSDKDRIGWVITKDYGSEDSHDSQFSLTPRVGWGMSRANAEDSSSRDLRITEDLDPKHVENPVKWKSYGDGETTPTYAGVIDKAWTDDEYLLGSLHWFVEGDAGDAIVKFKLDDDAKWEAIFG